MTFIHNRAEVTDNVTLGKNCWVSAFAVVNANEGFIEIGDNCSVQESCVIHGKGVRIGNNVTIGHGAVIHGAKIGSNVIVGIHATVLDGAEIGDNCIIGAGAIVTASQIIPENSMVLGIPGKVVRKCTEEDLEYIAEACENYLEKLKQQGLLE